MSSKNTTKDVKLKHSPEYAMLHAGFVSRIKLVMQEMGVSTQDALAQRIGTSQQVIAKWFKGSLPKAEYLILLSRATGKSIDWFLTGSEPVVTRFVTPPEIKVQQIPRFRTFEKTFAPERYIPIRLMRDAIAAGPPSEIGPNEEPVSWVLIYASREWMPNDPENYTCAYVRGQSMWPVLSDGDIVAIDHAARDPYKLDKQMVAFRVGSATMTGITIKWLKFFPEKKLVIGVPENKDEFDTVVTLKDEEIDFGIVGRVAWWWAKRSPSRR